MENENEKSNIPMWSRKYGKADAWDMRSAEMKEATKKVALILCESKATFFEVDEIFRMARGLLCVTVRSDSLADMQGQTPAPENQQ